MIQKTIQLEKKFNNEGYLEIFINGVWILEHRFIVERFLNRKLTKEEIVHHIDGNKLNNNISNLFLFKSQKNHKSFENKVRQFGFTNPIKRQILNRWNNLQ
jgi:hypothetical protein